MPFSGMATRCRIDIVVEGITRCRIYRHFDGYPSGVIADLYIFMKNYDSKPSENPESFLSNFIFYAKLSSWIKAVRKGGRPNTIRHSWECGYGVCAPDCEHGDLEYAYIVEDHVIKIVRPGSNTVLFEGTIDEAYKQFAAGEEFPDGCHIDKKVFNTQKLPASI
jgi:hypothetical protein